MLFLRAALPLLLMSLPAGAQPRNADSNWIRLRADNLEILSDAGERSARQALERLEQIRQVIPAGEGRGPLELRVFLFASQRDYRAYAPNPATSGFYQSGFERDYIVAHSAGGLDRVVVHEYIHFVLNQHGASLPHWFQEGIAEFYSNLEISRNRLRVGAPIEGHRTMLQRAAWLDAAALRFPPAGVEQGNETAGALYYAQSWALVHMLNVDPGYRDGMPRFAELLAAAGSGDVFQQAFGRTLEQALADLRTYLPRLRETVLPAPPLEPVSNAPPERLAAVDALLLRAELALRYSRQTLAAELYQQAARDYPNSAAAAVGLGALAWAQGHSEEARAQLERASELDPRNASAWFEYAMLEQETGAGSGRVRELLEKTVAANPSFAEAHALLGVRATDEGRYAAAVEHLQRAALLLPRRSYVWHALGFAQEKLGDLPAAAASARRAVRTAANPQQEAMAEALLESLIPVTRP